MAFLHFHEKETVTQVFSCEHCQIFKNSFLYGEPPLVVASRSHCSESYNEFLFGQLLFQPTKVLVQNFSLEPLLKPYFKQSSSFC